MTKLGGVMTKCINSLVTGVTKRGGHLKTGLTREKIAMTGLTEMH
jgi:hypothetical protein